MIITVFGATGQVGKEIVQQALYAGHTVRAFGRNVFSTNWKEEKNLIRVQGALFDTGQVSDAVSGVNLVLSAIGGSFDGTDKARSHGLHIVIEAMTKQSVQRIVALGGKGVLDDGEGRYLMDDANFPPEYLPVSNEHRKAYEYLCTSRLEWTFVCSPDIIPAPATGIFYTAAETVPVPDHSKINAGDLALFMLKEGQENQFLRQRVGISN
ncbi:MAG TPA: NAD(P)H-binding protein [Ferruginibacter sp.]|nr:NAD(P)H-binding protein [Ferruginibacter sp.]